MNYSENFKQAIELGTYLGTGNPNSKILVVGKEVATDVEEGLDKKLETQNLVSFNNNCNDWKKNINEQISQENIPNWNGNENNPLYAFKGVKIKKEGHTWRKYQKLNNWVFDKKNNNEINFQEDFFITEMSVLPSKTTSKAQKISNFKDELKKRKESFLSSDFIQDFPIIILACGNYISAEEITKIFKVNFIEEKGNVRQKFWIHWNDEKTKLVIHTRQLSANVSNELLLGIASEIKKILNK